MCFLRPAFECRKPYSLKGTTSTLHGALSPSPRRDDLGFVIKDRAGRTLPIPTDLITLLKSWKETHSGRLILGAHRTTHPIGSGCRCSSVWCSKRVSTVGIANRAKNMMSVNVGTFTS